MTLLLTKNKKYMIMKKKIFQILLVKKFAKDFAKYKKNTECLDKLLKEQEVLIKVMNQIDFLRYILYHSSASIEYCYERFNIALNQSSVIKEQIKIKRQK